MKQVVLLGSTGSIGCQALDIARAHPDRIRIAGLVAGRDVSRLASQIAEFQPDIFAVGDATAGAELLRRHPEWDRRCAGLGPDAVCSVAAAEADVVLNALLGYAGLRPSLAALAAGTDLALANKESMVVAGGLLRAAAASSGARIIPVDSEHSAIYQCLRAGRRGEVQRLLLTASGGPFRTLSIPEMARVSTADALRHPTWSMGSKISIDSATLMNKGLEILEAHALFDIDFDRIEVLVHPQSILHSMVEFVDGSMVGQLGTTDMRLPIWVALHDPERWPADFGRLDLASIGTLTFERLDTERFPCVGLAVSAGRQGGTYPAVLNAANEVAVAALLEERIRYLDIARLIEATLVEAGEDLAPEALDLDAIAAADARARRVAAQRVGLPVTPGAAP
jgi:1-deoxy-D-xylulose-5-phosphate reductoisomerase